MANSQRIKKIPRSHHYIPVFYLEGFIQSGSRDDKLLVLDLKTGRRWAVKPEQIAFERDFYRAELPGVEPDTIEKALSKIESQAASVLKTIMQKETLPRPKEEAFIVLLNMIALMITRVPRYRSIYSKPLEEMGKFRLKLMLQTPERWDAIKERMKRDGYKIDEKITYDQMKHFVYSDNYAIEIDRAWHLKTLIDSLDMIIPLLLERKWSLIITKNEAEGFICSDDPVTLMWSKPTPGMWGPGFGLSDTELIMPLNRNMVVLARFEGHPETFLAPRKAVAKINSRTAMYAHRFIYSSREDFIWLIRDGRIGNADDLLRILKTHRQKAK